MWFDPAPGPMVSDPVRAKARQLGADWWVAGLPAFVAELGEAWDLTTGRPLGDATEAAVFEVARDDGTPAVLKLPIPRPEPYARDEIFVLRTAAGDGCARLYRADTDLGRGRAAILMERLGPMMVTCGIPIDRRHELLVEAAARLWRPVAGSGPDTDADTGSDADVDASSDAGAGAVAGSGLPDGRRKAERLAASIPVAWSALDRPCSEAAVAHAIDCARRRADAHDPARSVLLHGDVHQWNALLDLDPGADRQRGSGPLVGDGARFKLVDPDGLVAEPEYDLGVLMREDPLELLDGDPRDRAERLAAMTGTDAVAVWEWGVIERVATGLLAARIGLQPVGSEMLAAADRIATLRR